MLKELDVKFPIRLYDSNGNLTYSENSDGYWSKSEYNSNGKCTYFEDSTGYCSKNEYNSNGNNTCHENSKGYWSKREFDSNGNLTYFEDSYGKITGTKRQEVEEFTVADIEKPLNKKIKIVKG